MLEKFSIASSQYKGSHSYNQLPDSNTLKIYYLNTDPQVNCTNPADKLRIEKEKKTSKSDLYWGLFWGFICIILVIGFIGEFIPEKKDIE